MAHPNRPSLMSRLFPHEDCPAGRLSSTEDTSSSTLFSAEKAPFGSSSSASFQDESMRRNDLYQACFASFGNATAEDRVQQDKVVEGDTLAPLKSISAIKSRQIPRVVLSLSVTNVFFLLQRPLPKRASNCTTLPETSYSKLSTISLPKFPTSRHSRRPSRRL